MRSKSGKWNSSRLSCVKVRRHPFQVAVISHTACSWPPEVSRRDLTAGQVRLQVPLPDHSSGRAASAAMKHCVDCFIIFKSLSS